ncbi:DNA mismatch repair endonuclease MutL [Methanolobus sp. ZRKC3]|uniref:DNA mismatch repair endonuclease MutL n=1 Tax=Methanolobus sp. ZRKC3 TaxID=3125786 RepID=UPI003253EEDA
MTGEACDISATRIRQLDESTINKIAAGEVIERPASVIKELIDNSIDAHASDIRVEIRGSGTKSILIVDNGIGMSHADASLAFKKHATSKISRIEDLDSILTLGFRGEALASIASVAKVEMVTRQEGDISGTKVVADGTGIRSISSAGSAVGTSILVNDLFYSTPARKKYMKSMRTELAHIIDVLTRHSMSHPDVSFTLVSDGKVILRSPSTGDLLDSIVHLYGADVARSLVPLEFESELVSISGYISKPELTRSGKDLQSLYINDRAISSRSLSNAVRLGYYTLLPKGRYPAAFLKFRIDTQNVDVNVHPTKKEVRLSHEKEIESAVISAVEQALKATSLVPELKLEKKEVHVQSFISEPEKPDEPESLPASGDMQAEQMPEPESKPEDLKNTNYETKSHSQEPVVAREGKSSYHYSAKDTQKRLKKSERLQQRDMPVDDRSQNVDIKILGQFSELYIIAEMDEKLFLVDQHAAHERVMYEQVLKMQDMSWQELIAPVMLDLNLKEKVIIEDYIPQLEKMGFAISEFGPNSYVVTTVPSIFGKFEDPQIIHDIISDLLSGGRVRGDTEMYANLCSTMACRAAIKAGAPCNPDQMNGLIRQLMLCDNPYTCPHGRPTMVSFSKDELGKMFGRT